MEQPKYKISRTDSPKIENSILQCSMSVQCPVTKEEVEISLIYISSVVALPSMSETQDIAVRAERNNIGLHGMRYEDTAITVINHQLKLLWLSAEYKVQSTTV